jgi:hypothetical protein
MAHGNDTDAARSPQYESRTFDPRGAFSWTLRAGEIARLKARSRAHYDTPTFDPRGAFSWTLRSGEIAARARRSRTQLPLGA